MKERTAYYLGVIDTLRKNLVVVTLGLIVAVLAALGVIKGFLTDTFPWLAAAAGGWAALLVALVALVAALIYGVQYGRYRRATRKLMWRYIIDVQDEQVGKPGRGPGQSDGVKRGEESADKVWGDRIYRELLNLPPEDEYR